MNGVATRLEKRFQSLRTSCNACVTTLERWIRLEGLFSGHSESQQSLTRVDDYIALRYTDFG